MLEFIKKEPGSKKYFHRFYGAEEFLQGRIRFVLWLGDCSPTELLKMPECVKRVEAVRTFRSESKRKSTVKLANTPTHFQTEHIPNQFHTDSPAFIRKQKIYPYWIYGSNGFYQRCCFNHS